MYKRTRGGFAILALFTAGCLWLLYKVDMPLGIDLQGGTELLYDLDLSHVPDDPKAVATEIKDIITRRLNAFGLKEISIAVEGDNRLVVQFPGTDQRTIDMLIQQVEKAGTLTFRIVAQGDIHQRNIKKYREDEAAYMARERIWAAKMRDWRSRKEADPSLDEPSPKPPRAPRYIVRPKVDRDKEGKETAREDMVLDNSDGSYVEGSWLSNVYLTQDPNTFKPAVGFEMRGEGATRFGDLTGNHQGELLAIVLDDEVVSAPVIRSRISTNGQITGDFTLDEVKGLITVLRGGSLPTRPVLRSESSVGSVFGRHSIESGIQAVIIGLLSVLAFITIYYLAAGMVTNFALVFNIFVVLAYVATFRQDLTLPGIAGILLTIGMAVDANILIFERVREERIRGKVLAQALSVGYQRAFSVIFDSNVTTVITGLVLFNFGTGPVKGFAVTLIAGIAVSFVSSLYVTKLFLSFLLNRGWIKQLKMLQAFRTPSIAFVEHQRPFMIFTTLVILCTWVFVIQRGWENYGIDFTGGARVRMRLTRALPQSEMEEKIRAIAEAEPDLFRSWSLQTIEADEEGRAREFALLTRAGAKGSEAAKVAEAQGESAPTTPAAPSGGEGGGGPAATGGGDASGKPAESEDAAQLVQAKLDEVLRADGLLLPPAFPGEPTWTAESGSTKEGMQLEVQLETVEDAMTTEWLQNELTKALQVNPLFTGISIEEVDLVGKPTETLPVSRYRLRMTPYDAPLPGVDKTTPSHEEAFEAIRTFFHEPPPFGPDGAPPFSLSEPFPQVATVGPKVASDLQGQAVVAIFISILGIIFYVSLRFEFIFGLAAIAALVHDVLITIGIMSVTDMLLGDVFPIKVNLPELAALLTIIGYSINDTIVVFDRIRENLKVNVKKRLTLRDCVDLSINQTLSRTLLTSLTTLFTVLSLLVLGGEAVRGFAYTFLIGLVTGTYSSVFVASPILILLHDRSEARRAAYAEANA